MWFITYEKTKNDPQFGNYTKCIENKLIPIHPLDWLGSQNYLHDCRYTLLYFYKVNFDEVNPATIERLEQYL